MAGIRNFQNRARRHRLVAMIVWVALLPGTSAARVAASDAPLSTSTISTSANAPPVRCISANPSQMIQDFAYARDGKSIYVCVTNRAVNVWELGVFYWPEMIGGFVALVVLASVITITWVRRHPRLVGEPYCRNCNFCLHGSDADRCPECGRSTHKIVMGRPMWRRLMPIHAVIALAILAYGVLWAAQLPRTGWVSNYFNWRTVELRKWAEDTNRNWLLKRVQTVSEIVECDAATGGVLRVLHTTRGILPMAFFSKSLLTSPDGSKIAMTVRPPNRWLLLEASSGRTLEVIEEDDLPPGIGKSIQHVIAFDDSGKKIFATTVDTQNLKTHLVEWDLETGSITPLLEAEAMKSDTARGPQYRAAEFSYIRGSSPCRFIEASRLERAGGSPPLLRSTSRPAEVERILGMEYGLILGQGLPVVGPDGYTIWSAQPASSTPFKWYLVRSDLETLAEQSRIEVPIGFDPLGSIRIPEMIQSNLLMCGAGWRGGGLSHLFSFLKEPQRGLLIFDLQSKKCRDFIQLPDNWSGLSACLAPDGRSCAVFGFTINKGPQRYRWGLMIFDLSNMPAEFDIQ